MKAEINKWGLRWDLKAVRESKALMFSGSLYWRRPSWARDWGLILWGIWQHNLPEGEEHWGWSVCFTWGDTEGGVCVLPEETLKVECVCYLRRHWGWSVCVTWGSTEGGVCVLPEEALRVECVCYLRWYDALPLLQAIPCQAVPSVPQLHLLVWALFTGHWGGGGSRVKGTSIQMNIYWHEVKANMYHP